MKAIVQDRYGSAEVLELREIRKPEPGPGEVLVRVRAAGVDPGVWHLMTGLPYLVRLMGFGFTSPKVAVRGRDLAGTVEAVGNDVSELRPGDEVFGIAEGTFAEYCVAGADRFALKPVNLSFEQAAAVPISGATALNALRDVGRVQPGQRVLVIGAGGGVGCFAVQLAKVFGAYVTGVSSGEKLELVRSLGADDVIDYTQGDFTEGPASFDLILDTAGRRPISQLRRRLTERGTLVIVGGEGGGAWLGGFERNLLAPLRAVGSKQRLVGLMFEERRDDLLTLKELLERNQLQPVIDRSYPLERAPDAIRYLQRGHARGKVVVSVA